jgi:tRNA A-37 threonylcarbamoyl transferase component Bud32
LAFVLLPIFETSGHCIQFIYWLTFSIIIGIGYTAVPYAVCLFSGQQDKLNVGKTGISLPDTVGLIPGTRPWRTWEDLKTATLVRKHSQLVRADDYIRLEYKNDFDIKLYLLGFNARDLEHFLLSLEAWAKHCRRSAELIEFQDSLHNNSTNADQQVSYTKIWEDELSRRFQSTNFVPLAPGATVDSGRLTIARQLAFGGTAAVYLALDQFQNGVVLKESVTGVETHSAYEAKAVEFFEREAKLLMVLKHPQIANVLDHFVENRRQYLVLEYVPGQNLRRLVEKTGPLPEKRVLELARQMAEILQYLHRQAPPVIHRDFTPDNLILRPDGNLTLIDFGAANEFVGTATGTLVGKQCYMPPEQVRGKATPSSDLYAMGGTLFFLLTASDPIALTTSHPKMCSPKLLDATDELVCHLTCPEEHGRPKTAQLVDLAIDAILNEIDESSSTGAAFAERFSKIHNFA